MNARSSVVRQQCSVLVVESNVSFTHSVNRADETSNDDKDSNDRDNAEEQDPLNTEVHP